mmetsp:Transcript_19446/g.48903  ORF Transcript_19446/g.48903 Transcript_19446/m.48903 type:complete len:389 (+) Transcript_19446:1540-2706(+)
MRHVCAKASGCQHRCGAVLRHAVRGVAVVAARARGLVHIHRQVGLHHVVCPTAVAACRVPPVAVHVALRPVGVSPLPILGQRAEAAAVEQWAVRPGLNPRQIAPALSGWPHGDGAILEGHVAAGAARVVVNRVGAVLAVLQPKEAGLQREGHVRAVVHRSAKVSLLHGAGLHGCAHAPIGVSQQGLRGGVLAGVQQRVEDGSRGGEQADGEQLRDSRQAAAVHVRGAQLVEPPLHPVEGCAHQATRNTQHREEEVLHRQEGAARIALRDAKQEGAVVLQAILDRVHSGKRSDGCHKRRPDVPDVDLTGGLLDHKERAGQRGAEDRGNARARAQCGEVLPLALKAAVGARRRAPHDAVPELAEQRAEAGADVDGGPLRPERQAAAHRKN